MWLPYSTAQNLMYTLMSIVMMMISVAFITLMERKILGMIQWRKGPNKITPMGISQPLADAIKLLSKEGTKLKKLDKTMYMMMPLGMMSLTSSIMLTIPSPTNEMSLKLSILMMLALMGTMTYPMCMGSWFSGSTYSQISSIRTMAQMISYEVSLMIIIVNMIMINKSLSLSMMSKMMKTPFMVVFSIMLTMAFMAEMNRTPMDLMESESELVSGFNTEYYSKDFAMIFIAEYMMIIVSSMILCMIVTKNTPTSHTGMLTTSIISMIILWMRSFLPRIRYDELMFTCWMIILPLSTASLMWTVSIKYLFNVMK